MVTDLAFTKKLTIKSCTRVSHLNAISAQVLWIWTNLSSKVKFLEGCLGGGGGGEERNLMFQIDRCINNTLATTEYFSILLISTEDIENS